MAQIYHFSKRRREKSYDYETSFCFKLPLGRGWLHLNKKATQLQTFDDYIKVTIQDWYIMNSDKHIVDNVVRRSNCELLQDEYETEKKLLLKRKENE